MSSTKIIPKQIILFSQPRTACHLLERMLTSKQEGLETCWHPFIAARPLQRVMLREESVKGGIPESSRRPVIEQLEEGVRVWEKALKQALDVDKTLYIHTHPHFALDPAQALEYVTSDWQNPKSSPAARNNYTLIPDTLLLSPGTIPILTFRHPAINAPSTYRAMASLADTATTSNILVFTNLGWVRRPYDFYISHGITPLLVEADDYMSSLSIVKELASQVGLDPEKCVFQWEKATEEEIAGMHPMYVLLQQTLLNSTGIVEEKVQKEVGRIEEEEKKWKGEFGEEAAGFLGSIVRAGMGDYEFLRERKVKVPSI